jgi:quercetin dioxygenase-like cupin family protein
MVKYVLDPKEVRTFVPAKHVKCNTKVLLEEANAGAKNLSMFRSEFEVGGYAESHSHTFEQAYYILKGRGIVTIGKEEYKIKPGNAVMFPPNMEHSIKNTGTTPLWLIAINAPPK